MESVSRFFPTCGRAALLATACLIAPLYAGDPASLSDRELAKRYQGVEEAQELLKKGDEAYRNERYAEAIEAFSGARESLPDAPATIELRQAATERFATASIQRGRELVRKGDLAGARKLVDAVLAPGVAPDHVDARCFRDQLDDPIRTNPALTAEHGKKVDDVRRTLYTAEGAFNLGKYDEAKSHYEKVLRIDPTNAAARRGMERIASAKSDYQKAAYDHTRAEMLSQVEGAWELTVPPAVPVIPALTTETAAAGSIPISVKLDKIILPQVDLEQVSIDEALDYLRAKSVELDTLELDPARKGVNIAFTLRGGPDEELEKKVLARRFNLRLRNVPLSQILRYINDQTHTVYSTDDFSVIVRPVGTGGAEMVSRTFRVPADFLATAGSATATAPAATDPFAEKPEGTGLLSKRRGVVEIFKEQGVTFPEGASASLNAATNTLMVRNTAANVDIIAQIVEASAHTEPVQVVVRVTAIKTEEHRLEELGFDWLLDGFGATNNVTVSGGTQGNGGDLGDIPIPPTVLARRPVTAGNRSGDEAISRSAIDDLIAISGTGSGLGNTKHRAPGALTVSGTVNSSDFQMIMRGLNQKKGVDLMAQPSVVTRSGQAATVSVVREFIYPTEYEPPELPNRFFSGSDGSFPVTPATPTAFEKRDVGIILEVMPTVSADKRFVEIELNPSLTDFDGFVNFGSPINTIGPDEDGELGRREITRNAILMPVFSAQRVKTNLTVADGSTVVIGGMIQEKIENVEDKTPLLGDLPVVGRLFQSKAVAPVKKAVIFLVNVQLLDPSGHPINAR
ncbi:MAG TPA: Amuc_1098 family type IV pilus outer membrane protein [Luteolibacter sp.]